MSLPPGFLDELRNRLSLAQVVGRKVAWDQRKSNQGKGDYWAPCPFHQEKTASFHVLDRDGYYYCFGCHAKGDVFSFVRETENVGFMEAVKILAGEAGMEVPQASPEAQAKADRRTELTSVMEEAVKWFRLQLKTGAAEEARRYLEGRGFDEGRLERWEIGFAPERGGAFAALTGKGVAARDVIDAGIAAESDRGGDPYDRFRDRIIFPIRDARGRAIAFGGRAMAADARAKYLNSPETLLFDKGRQLYNQQRAREAAGKGQPLVVAEGYMDVIALSEAGFNGAVAPLGTAITEDQLQLLWRIAPEPIIALDGDMAGLRAAMRLVDVALPMLEAGRSLRFALMPEGQDPDDLIRAGQAGEVRRLLDGAVPLLDLLWRRETEGRSFDSPERKAALDQALKERVGTIRDASVRRFYEAEIRDRTWQFFRKPRSGGWKAKTEETARQATKASALVAADAEEALREAVILATLTMHPDLRDSFEDAVERMECSRPDHGALRDAILRAEVGEDGTLRDAVAKDIGEPLERLLSQGHLRVMPWAVAPVRAEAAEACLAEEFAKLEARRGHKREIEEAEADISAADDGDDVLTWRIVRSNRDLEKAGSGDDEDRTEYEIGPNGARMKKDERSAFDALLKQIGREAGEG
ncbi:DNA primase [Aestuariibius sp. 2305UL40-4]|uniref:DNA primase n=1 Tax=Aestuariibius violaceus TaxID=3234132 RepID=UPI00345EFDF0